MEIKVATFIDQVTAGMTQETVTAGVEEYARLGSERVAAVLVDGLTKHVVKNELVQSSVTTQFAGEQVTLRLETGIINLPAENITKVANFFDDPDESVPVNAYLVVKSSAINRSGLRIDKVASVAAVLSAPNDVIAKLTIMLAEKQAVIEKNVATEK
ncbi:hypothetical protein ACI3E1_04775 [Ligilactobacillus sp. LYQ139]|uniref:hypothetical protein n=1 Tax=Ligilactobacillus sp. LYQ139 TaxID=3378800 RepID=UPI003854299F